METKKKTVEEIHEALECFTGIFEYHAHRTGDLKLLLTDGCDYIRREAEAYWLFYSILVHQMDKIDQQEVHQSRIHQKTCLSLILIFSEQFLLDDDYSFVYCRTFQITGWLKARKRL